jgi:type IV pilus assembly protein PilY1
MLKQGSKSLAALAAAAVFFGVLPHVQADDTEIFFANPPPGLDTRPNVLLIMDTSGSMRGDVETQEEWNAATDFDGSCNEGYVYWQQEGSTTLPSCSGGSQQRVSLANFVCGKAYEIMITNGVGTVTIGPAAQWKNSGSSGSRQWESLQAGRDSYVECQTDNTYIPRHGLTAGDGRVARNGSSGPFSTTSEIGWSGAAGRSYTFYTGRYLNYLTNAGRVTRTRLQVVQTAATNLLDQLLDGSVNIGLMRFDNVDTSFNAAGGYVVRQIAPIESVRTQMKADIAALNSISYTPLTETMFEAFRYFTGGNVYFGSPPTVGVGHSYSIDASRTAVGSSRYLSPMTNDCQANFVILLTDGGPTRDGGADSVITALPSFANRGYLDPTPPAANASCTTFTNPAPDSDGTGQCLDDIAKYMFSRPDLGNTNRIGKFMKTYTIGFGSDVAGSQTLTDVAAAGGGTAYSAGDTAELANAFSAIFRDILDDGVSFTAPAVAVNAFNRTQNLNDLYLAVFQPDNAYHWPGNLKKYRIQPDGTVGGIIMDNSSPSEPAVNPATGFFESTAKSFWSATQDGANVTEGGAANRIPLPADRVVFTNVSGTDLAAPANSVVSTNTLITKTMIGLTDTDSDAERTNLINWARGAEIGSADDPDPPRHEMGDPLHSRPTVVIYGGTRTSPDAVVFVATNDGYLHAISTANNRGDELWAFIPNELMQGLQDLRNGSTPSAKYYGIDGTLRSFKVDYNNNGIVDGADKVLLMFGLGRGGTTYYGLDVTDRSRPQLMWKLTPTELPGLGQTWSTPTIARVNISGTTQHATKLVAIFGGGYDDTQDNPGYATDGVGNRIFMIDAFSGNPLWSAGPPSSGATLTLGGTGIISMTHGIPSDIRVLDMTLDGFADRMYAADTGGRVWRFDITNGQPASSLVRGGAFASLGGADGNSVAASDARRFYYAPDTSLLRLSDGRYVMNLAIGSGYRGHPLNATIRDRFYSLRDPSPFAPIADYSTLVPIRDNDTALIDVTDITVPSTSTAASVPDTAKGWKIELRRPSWRGEKVQAESLTFNGSILFTTYTPTPSAGGQCTVAAGSGRFYSVRALDGRALTDRDSDTSTTSPDDRFDPLGPGTIPPPPVILFPTPDPDCVGPACSPPPVCLVGVEQCGVPFSNDPVRTFWNNQDSDTPE